MHGKSQCKGRPQPQRAERGAAPAPVRAAAEAAHGALDGKELAGHAVPRAVHLAERRAANDSLEGEVVLKVEHAGCAPQVRRRCGRHEHLQAMKKRLRMDLLAV
jgi:hypothetical protein